MAIVPRNCNNGSILTAHLFDGYLSATVLCHPTVLCLNGTKKHDPFALRYLSLRVKLPYPYKDMDKDIKEVF